MKMRALISLNIGRCVLATFTVVMLLLYTMHLNLNWDRNNFEYGQTISEETQGINSETLRVVHLDLKGAPPLMSYLKVWLESIAQIGCNALLVEYEDMFPFDGMIRNVSSKKAYSKAEISDFLDLCNTLNIEVIPLVQTFGHMEYVLKQPEFRGLRESPGHPDAICPSRESSFRVIEEMIRQLLEVHAAAKWIHIGCDEVSHIKSCPICLAREGNTKTFQIHATAPLSGFAFRDIFEAHVIQIAKSIKSNYPGVTPLIWDDMMRNWRPEFFMETDLPTWVEPVVWIYVPDVVAYSSIPSKTWFWYTNTFKNIWVAGSFKGSSGIQASLPNFEQHFSNNNNWLKHLKTSIFFTKTKTRGYILTGWSRYYHFAALCELLPPSMPSLVINLLALNFGQRVTVTYLSSPDYKALVFEKAAKFLKCSSSPAVAKQTNLDAFRWDECKFTGRDVYSRILEYRALDRLVNGLYQRHEIEKSSDWESLNAKIDSFRDSVRSDFAYYFHASVTNEWLRQQLRPTMNKLTEMNPKYLQLYDEDIVSY